MSVSYKQLHQIKCGQSSPHRRVHLIDSTIHGFLCCVIDGAVVCYDFRRYLSVTGSCDLRRDKPLPSHFADLILQHEAPIFWVAFNSTGLVLAVLTSQPECGSFVHLVQLADAIQKGPRASLRDCTSKSIRVCGGESELTAAGQPGCEPYGFTWNPTVADCFAVSLQSGSLRLFDNSQSKSVVNLVGNLPSTAGVTSISWSPKGKQLVMCITGVLSTGKGAVHGPSFLQTDCQLRLKRVVSLEILLKDLGGGVSLLDVLWTSAYCFLLGVRSLATGAMRALFINAPSSGPPTAVEVSDLRVDSGQQQRSGADAQYYFRLLGSSSGHAVASAGGSGEEILLLQLPSSSAQAGGDVGGASAAMCQPALRMELPPNGSVLGVTFGFLRLPNGANNTNTTMTSSLLGYISTLLTSGNVCTYLVNSPNLLASLEPSLPAPVQLPAVPPASAEAPPVGNNRSQPQEQQDNQKLQQEQTRRQVLEDQQRVLQQQQQQQLITQQNLRQQQQLQQVEQEEQQRVLQQQQQQMIAPENLRQQHEQQQPTGPDHESVGAPQSAGGNSGNQTNGLGGGELVVVATGLSPLHLPKSVHLAAEQFSTALRSEAESGRSAWQDLAHTMQHGFASAEDAARGRSSAGIYHVEARLQDVERFLQSLDEVNSELKAAAIERKADLSSAVLYTEKVRYALRLCCTGDWTPTLMNTKLDPEASRILNQLQRHGRLLEAGLLDLEAQIESASSGRRAGEQETDGLMQNLKLTDQLILAERNRVNSMLQSLERLRIGESAGRKGTSAGRPSPKSAATGDRGTASPWLTALVHRDRALYRRLFANQRRIHVVHAQSSYPPSLPAAAALSDKPGKLATPESPIILSKGQVVSHPQHAKLEQLILLSGEAAVANSPPRSHQAAEPATTLPPTADRKPLFSNGVASPATPMSSLSGAGSPLVTAEQGNSGFVLGQKAVQPPSVSASAGLLPTNSSLTVSKPADSARQVGSSDSGRPTTGTTLSTVAPSDAVSSVFLGSSGRNAAPPPNVALLPASLPSALPSATAKASGLPSDQATAAAVGVATPVSSPGDTARLAVIQSKSPIALPLQSVPVCTPLSLLSGLLEARAQSAPGSQTLQAGTRALGSIGAISPTDPSRGVPQGNRLMLPSSAAPVSRSTSTLAGSTVLFGGPAAVALGAGRSLFGDTKPTLFGSAATASSGQPAANTTTFQTSAPAASPGTISTSTATNTPSPSLFSGSAAATRTPTATVPDSTGVGGLLFGSTASTTTAPVVASGPFGAVTANSAGSPLFGAGASPSSSTTVASTSAPSAGVVSPPSTAFTFVNAATPTTTTSGVGLFGTAIKSLSTTGLTANSGLLSGSSATSTSVSTVSAGLFGAPVTSGSGGFAFANAAAPSGGLFHTFSVPPSTTTTTTSGFTFSSAATAASPTGLFGALNATSKSPAVTTQVGGSLFDSGAIAAATSIPSTVGLFGAPKVSATGASSATTPGLFAAPSAATTTNPGGGGLFSSLSTSPTQPQSQSPFGFSTGQPATAAAATNLFQKLSTDLFSGASSPGTKSTESGALATGVQPTSGGASGSLFGSLSAGNTVPAQSGGLFGSTTGTVGNVAGVFSNSFGLGGATQKPVENVFGRTSSAASTASKTTTGLFGSAGLPTAAATTTTTNAGGGGLFGASAFSFKQQSSVAATSPPTGSHFGSLGSGGLAAGTGAAGLFFGKPSGFGVAPSFGGAPAFGGGGLAPAAAGQQTSLFGILGASGGDATAAASTATNTLFGFAGTGATAAGAPAGGLFASLAAKGNSPSFGTLATGGSPPQPAATALFGTSPSFTQRRA